MGIDEVLLKTISADEGERQKSKQSLSEIAANDFAGYLASCFEAFAIPNLRTAAGIALHEGLTLSHPKSIYDTPLQWSSVPLESKRRLKEIVLDSLKSPEERTGSCAALLVVFVAAVERPYHGWPELTEALAQGLKTNNLAWYRSAMLAVGLLCESPDEGLQIDIQAVFDDWLAGVLLRAKPAEDNPELRCIAIKGLGNMINYLNPGLDNTSRWAEVSSALLMAIHDNDNQVRLAAFGCLNQVMRMRCQRVPSNVAKVIFKASIDYIIKNNDDPVTLAIEVWSSYFEKIRRGEELPVPRKDTPEMVFLLLKLMQGQEEVADPHAYTVSSAAYQALRLYAPFLRGDVGQLVITFIHQNLNHEQWCMRDTAVCALDAMLDVSIPQLYDLVINPNLLVLRDMIVDQNARLRDSTCFTLGRIFEFYPAAFFPNEDPEAFLKGFFETLRFPETADSSYWALRNVARGFYRHQSSKSDCLSQHLPSIVEKLLIETDRQDLAYRFRIAACEVLREFVIHSADGSWLIVFGLLEPLLFQLQKILSLQEQQLVEERASPSELCSSLVMVIQAMVQRLEATMETTIMPQIDRITQYLFLSLSLFPTPFVSHAVFTTFGTIARVAKDSFVTHFDALQEKVGEILRGAQHVGLWPSALNLITDIAQAMEGGFQPYRDHFAGLLLSVLPRCSLQLLPTLIEVLGDITPTDGDKVQMYLTKVGPDLHHVTLTILDSKSKYNATIRARILYVWDCIISACEANSPSSSLLGQYVEPIFKLLNSAYLDGRRDEALMSSVIGIVSATTRLSSGPNLAIVLERECVLGFICEACVGPQYSESLREAAHLCHKKIRLNANGGTESR